MDKKNTFLWGSPRVLCVKKVQVNTPPLLGLPTQTSARVQISISFVTVSISNGCSFFSDVSYICDWWRTTGMKGCRPQGFRVVFLCVVDVSADPERRTAWKSPNLPLFVPLLLIPPTFSLSAHCWPQSHQTLGVLADAEAPVRGRPDELQPGTGRGGPLVGRAGPEPESGESSPPSPPSPLPSTPRQGQREEAEVPGPSDHCAAVQHCWWVRTDRPEETVMFLLSHRWCLVFIEHLAFCLHPPAKMFSFNVWLVLYAMVMQLNDGWRTRTKSGEVLVRCELPLWHHKELFFQDCVCFGSQ